MVAEVIIMREEEKKRKSQKSGMKRFLSKRWALPAVYLASAAILIAAVLWFQNSNNDLTKEPGDIGYEDAGSVGKGTDKEAVEVNSKLENFSWPIAKEENAVVKKQFYDMNADKEEQENALVFYDNKYHLNRGIDIAMKDGKTFDVLAAVSGKVTNIREDSLLGNVIEIEHDTGITTQYQSINEIAVKVGDTVVKGQAIAKAGQSLLNEEAGIHVHFEIRKDSVAVNPLEYFEKSVSALMDAEVVNGSAQDEEAVQEDKPSTDEPTEDESTKEHSDPEDSSTEKEPTETENKLDQN